MRTIWVILVATQCHGAEVRDDLLSFLNGDQLHGRFSGIAEGPSVRWNREDVGEEVKFKSPEVRRIVLRGGFPAKPLGGLSHIGTVNGDRIPGIIRDIDDKRVLLETAFGGMLEIPREQVGLLAPNPLGGRVLYHGPFDPEQWTMFDSDHPDGIPAVGKDAEDKKATSRWKFSGSAWYWQNEGAGTTLAMKSGMPDRAVLKFDIAWKSRLSLTVGFHSNFKRPAGNPANDENGDEGANIRNRAVTSGTFGDGYVLQIYSSYLMLHRSTIDAQGNPRLDRIQTSLSNVRLGDSGKASVEIRCNRLSGEILLFIDGEFVAQWSELKDDLDNADGYAGKGNGFGFVVPAENSAVRISEVVVAEWNGMPDAARSLQVDDADIVLLSNGTDRFSGKVTGLHDEKLKLEGRYGDFELPLSEIAEVRFAKSRLAVAPEATTDEVKVRLYPVGRISGQPLAGDGGRLRMVSQAAGEMDINLDHAVMLEFKGTETFLDDWDDEF